METITNKTLEKLKYELVRDGIVHMKLWRRRKSSQMFRELISGRR